MPNVIIYEIVLNIKFMIGNTVFLLTVFLAVVQPEVVKEIQFLTFR